MAVKWLPSFSTSHASLCQAPSVGAAPPDLVSNICTFRAGTAEHTIRGGEPPDREQWLARLPEVIHQNPVVTIASRGGGPVLRISDLLTQREFRRTDFYQEIMRPLDCRDRGKQNFASRRNSLTQLTLICYQRTCVECRIDEAEKEVGLTRVRLSCYSKTR